MNQSFTLAKGERSLTRIVSVLSALAKDVEWVITIAKRKKDRTEEQNNALYGVAYKALREFTGYQDAELHPLFLKAYFGTRTVTAFGETVEIPRRTTTTDETGRKKKLNTEEFAAFYAFVQQKGAEIGCWVPDPDPMFHLHQEERAA